jgi:hypothetical protein
MPDEITSGYVRCSADLSFTPTTEAIVAQTLVPAMVYVCKEGRDESRPGRQECLRHAFDERLVRRADRVE